MGFCLSHWKSRVNNSYWQCSRTASLSIFQQTFYEVRIIAWSDFEPGVNIYVCWKCCFTSVEHWETLQMFFCFVFLVNLLHYLHYFHQHSPTTHASCSIILLSSGDICWWIFGVCVTWSQTGCAFGDASLTFCPKKRFFWGKKNQNS